MGIYDDLAKLDQEKEIIKQEQDTQKATLKLTQDSTHSRDRVRDLSRGLSRQQIRKDAIDHKRPLPTRDEVQEFSFRLRDALRVKVQAELPHEWQKELEEIAIELKVKKLELYRYIFGAFLGKIEKSMDKDFDTTIT